MENCSNIKNARSSDSNSTNSKPIADVNRLLNPVMVAFKDNADVPETPISPPSSNNDSNITQVSAVQILFKDGESMQVHKEALMKWSTVFRTMFTIEMKEKQENKISMDSFKREEFQSVLDVYYNPETEIIGKNLGSILKVAHMYGMEYAIKRCEDYLLHKKISMNLLIYSQTFSLTRLLEKCIECASSVPNKTLTKLPQYSQLRPDIREAILTKRLNRCDDLILKAILHEDSSFRTENRRQRHTPMFHTYTGVHGAFARNSGSSSMIASDCPACDCAFEIPNCYCDCHNIEINKVIKEVWNSDFK